jgi:hypothetical protein
MAYSGVSSGVCLETAQWVETRRPIELDESYVPVVAEIDTAAHEAYGIWSDAIDRSAELIRQQPGSCLGMSLVTQGLLSVRGVTTQLMEYRLGVGAHYYLETVSDNPNCELAADTTWQQMLWEARPDYETLPDVLIIPSAEPEAALRVHSVPDLWMGIWRNSRKSDCKWQDLGHPISSIMPRILGMSCRR